MVLLYLAISWVRIASDFSLGVARVEWTWTTALVRGESNATVYARSDNPRGFWWCTTIKVVIHAILTLGVLIVLLET
jgi:hypothetical protein